MQVFFAVYVAGAVYGCTRLEQGLELHELANDDSYARRFYDAEYGYFRKYGPYVSVVVEAPLNYSSPQDQVVILLLCFLLARSIHL